MIWYEYKLMEYLYILDYNTPGIWELKLSEEEKQMSTEEILEKYCFNEDECSVMWTTQKLSINSLN